MGGVTKPLTKKQVEQVKQLLIDGVGIKKICKIAKCSNTSIYKIGEKEGIRFKNAYKPLDTNVAVVDDFVCPGIKHCVHCKHIFESVCPMG